MFEDLDELEGEFFDLSQGECKDHFFGYQTICYGLLYEGGGTGDFLRYLYTEESEEKIGYSKIYESSFYNCKEDIQSPDASIYPDPGCELIKRVFEFEWE